MKLEIRQNEHRKVQMSAAAEARHKADDTVSFIVVVDKDDYVPKDISIHDWMSGRMFTAEADFAAFKRLEHDPEVVYAKLSDPLHPLTK